MPRTIHDYRTSWHASLTPQSTENNEDSSSFPCRTIRAIQAVRYPRKNAPPPPPIRIEGEVEYEVEEILKSKIDKHNGVLQYLVKWKGCPATDNTWEPAINVKNAPKLVEQFHKCYPNMPQ